VARHFDEMRAAMRLRDALVPYIYTAGLAAYRTGVSLLRPMYYSVPNDSAAYDNPSQVRRTPSRPRSWAGLL
jgi:alpha-glucosidase (family GH31 glycosyl hydrolase)